MSTSARIEQYLINLENGELKSNEVKVLNYIKNNPDCIIDDIRRDLKMKHQTATSRISELFDCGVIKVTGQVERLTITERKLVYSTMQFVEPKYEQDRLRKERLKEKLQMWAKRGLELMDELQLFDDQFDPHLCHYLQRISKNKSVAENESN